MRNLNAITSLDSKDAINRNKDINKSHLQNILKASAIINSKLDLNHVLEHVIHFALKLTNSVAASIILLSDIEDELVIAHSTDLKTNFKFPMKKSISGLCISTGQIKVVNDVKRNPQHFKKIDESTGFKSKCLLCVPLKIKGKTYGCIMLINKRDNTTFNDDDITVAAVMSNFAAVSIRNAEIHENLQSTNLALMAELPSADKVIGENREVRTIYRSIKKLKDTNTTVLILGESGTGKGVLARAIHEQSNRRESPFITVNCAIYSKSLLESELFGHERGAFTGADRLKKGRFELARGGTIFLDEIGEMEMSLQTKLLRVLQEKEFERVGGTETLVSDVRIIAATNTNLENALEQKLFREDLYYRLKVMDIHMPPLRNRKEDIPAFAGFFLNKYRNELNKQVKGFNNDSMNALLSYDYPGNIRELENIVERAVVLAEDDAIHIHDLPDEIKHRKYKISNQVTLPENTRTFCNMEKKTIEKTLYECSWNQSMASRLLGLTRNKLRYRMKKYQLTEPETTY